jgi:hypothetical protein
MQWKNADTLEVRTHFAPDLWINLFRLAPYDTIHIVGIKKQLAGNLLYV